MENMTQLIYIEEIKGIATNLVKELMDEYEDREEAEEQTYDRLHETIDGHQWVIYYAYNEDVLEYSDNDEAYQDCYDNESLGALVAEKGIDGVKPMMAYFAMYQDVSELLEQAFDDYQAELETSEAIESNLEA